VKPFYEFRKEFLKEDVLDSLKKIVSSKTSDYVKFDDGRKLKVDLFTAAALTKVYDAVTDSNKDKMKDMLNAGSAKFMKLVDFAMSKVGK
jgi:hypothetical protein